MKPVSTEIEAIIEGDQIQVAAFSLEYSSYLTRSPRANENASIKSAKPDRLIRTNHTIGIAFSLAQGEASQI